MIPFTAIIERFQANADKTGWSYVFIPQEVADQIRANDRRGFRVRGFIDQISVSGLSVLPVRESGFILPLNKPLRKILRKEEGAKVSFQLEFDVDFKIEMPDDLEICLADEENALGKFLSLTKSHQNYFINWINTAKTDATRTKRILMILTAMANNWDFGTMMRGGKAREG